MNMEVLINVVILFIIIVSLLKRVQAVSKKGDEVKRVPEGPPDPLAETIKEAQRRSEMQERMNRRTIREVFEEPERQPAAPPIQQEEIPSGPPSLEDIFRRITDEIRPDIQEMAPEPVKEEMFPSEQVSEPVPEPQYDSTPSKRFMAARRRKHPVGLSFKGPEVVRGIVLSEILGPPVALRSERIV